MSKTAKTFRLDDKSIQALNELTELTGKSQAEVIKDALQKAYGDQYQDQRDLVAVYNQVSETIQRLQYQNEDQEEWNEDQKQLHDFFDDVFDKCKSMPQFPEWA